MKPQFRHVEHTAEFSSRRRALFPCVDNSNCDSDQGCISPLNFDSNECCTNIDKLVFSLSKCVGDYDIIGLVEDKDSFVQTPTNSSIPSKITTPVASDDSPTQKLKTPHDTCDNTKFPKLIRNKTQIETAPNPKVRTALFPEIDLSFPSRTFYPKNKCEIESRSSVASGKTSPKKKRKKQSFYLCNRKSRFKSGQINAGVRHKIKKRKSNKTMKISTIEAAVSNIIENSPLNSFLSQSMEKQPEVLQQPSPQPRNLTPSPEPDHTRKFFKSSRHKGVVTINPNIKFEMKNGHFSLISNKKTLKRPRLQEEVSTKRLKLREFEHEQPLIPEDDISYIIHKLGEDKMEEKQIEKVVLMSPTSQMCNMTSGLALNSPKKARDLTTVLETMSANNEQSKKLFPIFYSGKILTPTNQGGSKHSNTAKKMKALSKNQMLLDAGQKRWGVTQCCECKIVYNMGDPSDEIMHLNYHNAGHIFRFNGWKNERVVSNNFLDTKIIHIVPTDPKMWWKKVKEVMEVVNRDLGFYDIEFSTVNSQIFFYIKNKIIVGALVAEVKTAAHKLLTTHQDQVDLCSEESYPIKCGISRIWVAQNQRKQGVATALMDSLKKNFIFGYVLKNEEIAFSSPTELGKIFGQRYFKTSNFLIYFV